MEPPVQKYQEQQPFLVDVVITPFSNYIVVDYKNPHILENPKRAGDVFDFSREYIFEFAPGRRNLESSISRFLEQRPDLEIDGERVRHSFDMPSGKLSYVLSQETIGGIAKTYCRECIAKAEERIKEGLRIFGDAPSIEETEEDVRYSFTRAVWGQLIRKTSQNYLQFDNDAPPQQLILDEQGRGFALIGGGMGSNCGYGSGNLFLYKVLDNSTAELSENKIFQRSTMQVEHIQSTTMGRIPVAFTSPEKLEELCQKGMVINFEDWPTFIKLDNVQSGELQAVLNLGNSHLEENNPQTP